jgi:NAD(P)-dependent dehydrogenase (short-subunit alcohol dehydrogenase family)
VQAFAKRGAHIGLLARGIKGLEGAKQDAEALGGQALVLPTDVAYPEQVEAAAQKAEETFGPIDIWVNDAMTSVFSPFKEMTPEEFRRVTEVTYLGSVYGTMAVIELWWLIGLATGLVRRFVNPCCWRAHHGDRSEGGALRPRRLLPAVRD